MRNSSNVLSVFADELRYTALGCSGNRVVRAPHADQLAAEALTFDQAFSSCPIWSPHRGQILTGPWVPVLTSDSARSCRP